MAARRQRRTPLQLLVIFSLLILSSQIDVRDVQEKLSRDDAAGHLLHGEQLRSLSDSRLIPDQLLLHNDKDLDTFLVHFDEQTMEDWLQSVSETSPSFRQKVLVLTSRTNSSNGKTRQENIPDPQQRVPVSRKLLYNQSCGSESEPNQENPQTYKVVEEPDPVSSSRTPQRPDGPMVEFDHQQILMLGDDEVVRTAAASLYDKHPTVSSVYAVGPQQRVQQVKGQAVALSERSSLVLVGHGARDRSGEMRISGYSYQDVARIIQSSSRISQKVQTTTVVACDVGSDRRFREALLKELHEAGVETELHLWKTVVQVAETGEVLSQDVSADGPQWRSEDLTKKVVLTVGSNGEIRTRREEDNRGHQVLTSETRLLDDDHRYRKEWPKKRETFIDPNVYEKVAPKLKDSPSVEEVKKTFRILESMAWGLFHPEPPEEPKQTQKNTKTKRNKKETQKSPEQQKLDELLESLKPRKLSEDQQRPGNYIIGERDERGNIHWLEDNNAKEAVLQRCYVIETGRDIRNIIRHFAKDGEDGDSYLLIKDWMFLVKPDDLYVYPIGKRLKDDDDRESERLQTAIRELIAEQNRNNAESYRYIPKHVPEDDFITYVGNIFQGQPTCLDFNPELFSVWYFTASVIAESSRNFRTFPLVLMALSMEKKEFWFDDNYITMADGGSWLNKPSRGFKGSASGDLNEGGHFVGLLVREYRVKKLWLDNKFKGQTAADEFKALAEIAIKFKVFTGDKKRKFVEDCIKFFKAVNDRQNIPSASHSLQHQTE